MKIAVLLGTFDGLHAGHCAVIDNASGFYSIAITFTKPPKSVMTNESNLLILPEEKINRMKSLGVDEVVSLDFQNVKDLSPDEFLNKIKEKFSPDRIVCGFNYRFGKNAAGDTSFIEKFCTQNAVEFVCVSPVKRGDSVVSSTQIRALIRDGKMSEASSQIYGGFGFTAPVIHGDARGRLLGFPTANQEYPDDLVTLKFGVYISRVNIDGTDYNAITNVGVRPTYLTDKVGCETFIKGFDGDIYGKKMKLELLHFVREEQKFQSEEQLKNAVLNDIKLLTDLQEAN